MASSLTSSTKACPCASLSLMSSSALTSIVNLLHLRLLCLLPPHPQRQQVQVPFPSPSCSIAAFSPSVSSPCASACSASAAASLLRMGRIAVAAAADASNSDSSDGSYTSYYARRDGVGSISNLAFFVLGLALGFGIGWDFVSLRRLKWTRLACRRPWNLQGGER
ncbi:hypothetical protein BKA70DRAFT_371648 [Coprinopsis sp. MPI-PUGE-AT-0042]|nr:hypothetical protein BKA70DRAFT_371648 [Coprinopsis sp. MPI-PUGE-AT-0042]